MEKTKILIIPNLEELSEEQMEELENFLEHRLNYQIFEQKKASW